MAYLTPVNGTTQPVFATDVSNGSIAGTANIRAQGPVNFQGPKLDFFSLVANAVMTSAGNVNGFLQNTFQQVQSGGGIVDGGAGGTIAPTPAPQSAPSPAAGAGPRPGQTSLRRTHPPGARSAGRQFAVNSSGCPIALRSAATATL